MTVSLFCLVLSVQVLGLQLGKERVAEGKIDPVAIACEMRRERVQLASSGGRTTVAVEMRVGRYAPPKRNIEGVRQRCDRLRENCARLTPRVRYQFPECLIVEEFDARRAGDFDACASLYEEGYNRDRARSRIKGTPVEMQEALSRFDTVLLETKCAWDSYLTIRYGMVGSDRQGCPWSLHLKHDGDRYWLTEESGAATVNSIYHQLSAPFISPDVASMPQPPKDMLRLRLSLNQGVSAEDRAQRLAIDTLQEDVPEQSNAMVLYVRPVVESAPVPLLQADTERLDGSGSALKVSLTLYSEKTATIQDIVALWAPESRENIEANLHHLQRAGFPLNSRFFGKQIDKVRLIARVETEEGIVCYVRYPKVSINPKAGVGQGRMSWEAGWRTLIQRKIGTEYGLALRLTNPAVSDILTHKDLVAFISRWSESQP